MARQKIQELKKEKYVLETKSHDVSIEELPK
jgi:hypothetical protein